MNQSTIDQISDALLAAKHEPNHPSYTAFVAETIEQFKALRADGFTFTTYDDTDGAYAGSQEMFNDLAANKHLSVYNAGSPMAENHPLAAMVLEFGITVNVMFRAVHDINGHLATMSPFETFEGELAAYRNHSIRYSGLAQSALYGETIAQLCHYYSRGSFVPVQTCAILPILGV